MTSEHQRIAEIRRRLADAWAHSAASKQSVTEVDVSIGDDAAVLAATNAPLALSIDTAVEGVHFTRALLSYADIGFRAFSAAISDLAAMGATPRAALSALILPADLEDAALFELVDGLNAAQQHYCCPIVGGNLARGSELSITTTVIGALRHRSLLRSGAHAGDSLYVTGALGSAALGLRLLQQRSPELSPICVARFRHPEARIREGQQLALHASAAIDVSDGLLQDLGHLCTASSLGCNVDLSRIPLPSAHEAAATLGLDLLELALTGGEDYELLFAAASEPPAHLHATRIGTFVEPTGIRLFDAHGRQVPAPHVPGFDHFANRP